MLTKAVFTSPGKFNQIDVGNTRIIKTLKLFNFAVKTIERFEKIAEDLEEELSKIKAVVFQMQAEVKRKENAAENVAPPHVGHTPHATFPICGRQKSMCVKYHILYDVLVSFIQPNYRIVITDVSAPLVEYGLLKWRTF